MSNPPRRKNPKTLPRLPLSAFAPPSASTSDSFPLPPSPHSVHPSQVIDANVILTDEDVGLTRWFGEAGTNLSERVVGVVLTLPITKQENVNELWV